jgi:hypothetical protein
MTQIKSISLDAEVGPAPPLALRPEAVKSSKGATDVGHPDRSGYELPWNRSQSPCPRRCGIATQLGLFR